MAPKKIPNARIIQHFISLPEAKRIELLSKNLSPETIKSLAANEFYEPMSGLKKKPEKEAKAYLKKYFGDTEEHLKKTLAHGEEYLGSYRDSEYTKFLARTDEEKMYAQACCETLSNRLSPWCNKLKKVCVLLYGGSLKLRKREKP